MTDYLTDFVQESEERITELNNALLTLERDPDDEEAMENIFRIAHTLKGNCGAMGLESASDLAHAIEDLLDAVRGDDLAVTPELMDVVFDAVDELETMVDEVATGGEIETDPSTTIDALRDHLEHAGDEPATGPETPAPDEIDEICARFAPPADDEVDVYLARLEIAEREGVNNGELVIDALVDAFELIGTEPPRERVEAAEYDGRFDAVFATAVGEAAIGSGLEPVAEVEDFEIIDVTDRFERTDAAPVADEAADAVEPDDITSADAQDLEVDELLDEFDEFDDLDEMVEDVEDEELNAFEDMGEAGSFDDLLDEEDVAELEAEPGQPPAENRDEPDEESEPTATGADAEPTADDEVDDAGAVFDELKDEVEMVGFDELQDELAELEFDEFDEEEEVDMDELLGEDAEDEAFLEGEEPTESAVDDMLVDAEPADESAVDTDAVAAPAPDAADLENDGPDEIPESGDDSLEADPVETDEAVATDGVEPESTAADVTAEGDDASEPAEAASTPSNDGVDEADDLEADVSDEAPTDETDVSDEAPADDPEADVSDEAPADDPGGDDVDGALADEPTGDAVLDETTVDDGSDEPAEAAGRDEPAGDDTGVTQPAADSDFVMEDVVAGDADGVDADAADTSGLEADETAASEPDDESPSAEDDGTATDSFGTETADDFDPAPAFDDGLDSSADADPVDDDTVTEIDDDAFDVSADPVDLEATADEEDEFDDSLDDGFDDSLDDGFDDSLDDGFDDEFDTDAGFGSSTDDETDSMPSAASFGDDDDTDDDDDDVVRTVDEPEMEIPDIEVPDTDGLADAGEQTDEIQSVRVDVEQVDSLLTLVEGLVTSRVRLRHAADAADADDDGGALDEEIDALSDLTTDLQETVMDIRLVPLRAVTNRLPRVVRDIARDQDKSVAFDMTGEDVELDRSILDRIGDPLIHLVRNAVDHGIEAPDRREAVGKSREGTVEVHAERSRDRVTITVEDDGGGLDPDRLRDEAVEAGVLEADEAAAMPDEETYDLIFHSGLSTVDEVTDVSGRGVGMDVVKRTVEDLDGTVSIDSEAGEGTTVTIELPVTVAIDEILFVESGGEEFGLPTKAVRDIESAQAIETAGGETVLPGEDGEYPVVSLADALETPAPDANGDGMVVRIRDEVREVALHCDRVRGQQEVVVKPFEGFMSGVPGISGATVRGRGEVVNILDVTTL